MSKNKDKKIETVGRFEEKVKRAKAVILTDYRGLTHKQLENFRKVIKQADAEYVVTKNTLLNRALTSNDRVVPQTALKNPTATLFAYNDILGPIKALVKMVKELKMPIVKSGILDGKTYDGADITKLASLPPREVLLAQLVGGMKSPIYGLHRALNWNIQKLVLTLKAIEKNKASSNQPSAVS